MNSDIKPNEQPKISIGMPVYNGEFFIRKAIESLLAQTFGDFELIISDNASTDSTSTICLEYAKKDKRIRYINQPKNMGGSWNFSFVLEEAKYPYFMWAAADDYWHQDFLKKNLNVLLENDKVVCSISKIQPFEIINEDLKSITKTVQYPSIIKNFVKKRRHAMISVTYPIMGSYEKKIRLFLRNTGANSRFYGLFRTDQLRRCFIKTPFIAVENAIFLDLLKIGDLYEINEILMYRFDEGFSTRGIINMTRTIHGNFWGVLFPLSPFTNWCAKNIGSKYFLLNIDIFIRLNIGATFFLVVDLILSIKNRYLSNRKFQG